MKLEIIKGITSQHDSEIEALYNFLLIHAPNGIKNVLDVGTCLGGTAYIFSQLATGKVITIDLSRNNDGREPMYRKMKTKVPIIEVTGNSTDPVVMQAVRNILDSEPVDLLFIDGDHSYNGCKADFINYSPMVRNGGWIGFHDIIHIADVPETCRVDKVWEEIKGQNPFFEFVFHRQDPGNQRTSLNPSIRMGIGLL